MFSTLTAKRYSQDAVKQSGIHFSQSFKTPAQNAEVKKSVKLSTESLTNMLSSALVGKQCITAITVDRNVLYRTRQVFSNELIVRKEDIAKLFSACLNINNFGLALFCTDQKHLPELSKLSQQRQSCSVVLNTANQTEVIAVCQLKQVYHAPTVSVFRTFMLMSGRQKVFVCFLMRRKLERKTLWGSCWTQWTLWRPTPATKLMFYVTTSGCM